MRVRIDRLSATRRRLYPVQPEIYLRGAILTHYDDGQWSNRRQRSRRTIRRRPSARAGARGRPAPPAHWVRQEITIEPLDRDELFCIWPIVTISRTTERVLYDSRQGRLRRRGAAQDAAVHLCLGHDGVCRRPS